MATRRPLTFVEVASTFQARLVLPTGDRQAADLCRAPEEDGSALCKVRLFNRPESAHGGSPGTIPTRRSLGRRGAT